MRAMALQHQRDPRTVLQEAIGDISWFKLYGPRVLVATYDPGAMGEVKTKGGIILTDADDAGTLAEYRWQGKVGLVLATGPLAFSNTDDGRVRFDGMKAEIGDWVLYRASDGMQMLLDQFHCRVLSDVQIIAVVPEPDRIL